MFEDAQNFIDVLDHWAAARPDELALGFLEDGETLTQTLTFAELRGKYTAAARYLGPAAKGRYFIIMCEPGLDFMVALFATIAAGGIAVPISAPSRKSGLAPLARIVGQLKSCHLITTTALMQRLALREHDGGIANLQPLDRNIVLIDQIPAEATGASLARHDQDICLIQYTSGSTSQPKGVVLTHKNVLKNQAMIKSAFNHDTDSTRFVSWLPQFHDMGLIGNMLQPLYLGCPSIFFSPLHFLQRPARWLQAISKYRATTSGAPNFAYELCVDRVSAEVMQDIDLSCWTIAYCGSEPVHAKTMNRFSQRFKQCGFDSRSLLPCYGLAEATLLVAGWHHDRAITSRSFDKETLHDGMAVPPFSPDSGRELVCIGQVAGVNDVRIVNPDTCAECPEGIVGEIWVHGEAVGKGYFGQEKLSQERFSAIVADCEPKPFLRTGDLGFTHEGGLYFAGRLNDLVIVRGKNYFPQDIELSVDQALGGSNGYRTAAFNDFQDTKSRLVIVREISSSASAHEDSHQIKARITAAVANDHGLRVDAIMLVPRGTIPVTTSGKVRRSSCKDLLTKASLQ